MDRKNEAMDHKTEHNTVISTKNETGGGARYKVHIVTKNTSTSTGGGMYLSLQP